MSATGLRRSESAQAPTLQHPWVRWLGRILSGALILASVLLGYFIYKLYYANPRTDDAYVHANTAALAAHVSGQIVQLPITDNQHVKKNDLLFVVDPRPYKLALDTATTKLKLTEIEIKTLQDTIDSAAAGLAERKIDAANARQYLDRIVPLRDHDFVTDNDLVEARNKLKAAEAAVVSASSELAASPTLATLPRSWVVRTSQESTSPPRLSIAPPQSADSSGCEPKRSSVRCST